MTPEREAQTEHVPEPAGGVRGADQVDGFDSSPGHGTTTGADGLSDGSGGQFEATAALGATDDPEGGSIQRGGA